MSPETGSGFRPESRGPQGALGGLIKNYTFEFKKNCAYCDIVIMCVHSIRTKYETNFQEKCPVKVRIAR